MKATIKILLFCCLAIHAVAQTTLPFSCQTGTSRKRFTTDISQLGNPDPVLYDKGYKVNRFDWTTETFLVNKPSSNLFPLYNATNPFWSPYYSQIDYYRGLLFDATVSPVNRYFKPQDGWELVGQDFGYITSDTPPYVNEPIYGENRKLVYFILYNKYTAKLRVLAVIDKSIPNQTGVDIILEYRTDHFTESSTGIINQFYPTGLFNHYASDASKEPITQPLDQVPTITQLVSTSQPIDRGWIVADFQLAYDPCACMWQSSIKVHFRSVSNYALSASGLFYGTAQPLSQLTQPPTGQTINNYLTSRSQIAGTDATTFNGNVGMQAFQDVNALQTNYENALTDYANNLPQKSDFQNDLESVIQAVEIAVEVVTIAAAIARVETTKTFTPEDLKKGLENGSTILNFMSAGTEVGGESPPAQPMIIQGEQTLYGTVTATDVFTDYATEFGTPGSLRANTYPEIANSCYLKPPSTTCNPTATQNYPNYPMYNELPGLFALLKTPKLTRYNYRTKINKTMPQFNKKWFDVATFMSNSTGPYFALCTEINENLVYHFDDALMYHFNEAVPIDEAKTQVMASFVFEDITTTDDTLVFESHDVTKNPSLPSSSMSIYGTPFVSPEKLPLFYPMLKKRDVHRYPIPVNTFLDWSQVKYYDYNYNTSLAGRVYLKLALDIVFKPDVYGIIHRTLQILTYPVNVVDVPVTAPYQIPGIPAALATTQVQDLTIPATTFDLTNTFSYVQGGAHGPGTTIYYQKIKTVYPWGTVVNDSSGIISIYAWGNIHITGNLTLGNRVTQLNIFAGGEVIVDGEVALAPGVMYTSFMLTIPTQPYKAQNSYTDVMAFCQGGTYFNGPPTQIGRYDESGDIATLEPEMLQNAFGIYPNPTAYNATVHYSLSNNSQVNLYISDLYGSPVVDLLKDVSQTSGNYSTALNTYNLAAGTYFCVLEKNGEKSVERLVVVK